MLELGFFFFLLTFRKEILGGIVVLCGNTGKEVGNKCEEVTNLEAFMFSYFLCYDKRFCFIICFEKYTGLQECA